MPSEPAAARFDGGGVMADLPPGESRIDRDTWTRTVFGPYRRRTARYHSRTGG
jgi:hypothetical protein